jgi:phage baseplate assembly protein W
MSKLPRYRGFSTASYLTDKSKGFMLTNQDLVKQDILNHLYTIPGERPHQPNFGTRIPLLPFEPLTEDTVKIIKEDITKVMEYDPRVKMTALSVQALPNNSAIVAFVDLLYLELNVTETLKLDVAVGA